MSGADSAIPPPAQLGLLLARADLGYIRSALDGGVVERGLAFLQHAVLVAFEAYGFCSRQLGLDLPALAWDQTLATASRNTGKFFDDNRRDLLQLASEVNALADRTHEAFTGGLRGRLTRALGVFSPDLGVMFVTSIPVSTTVTMAYHAGALVPGPDNLQQAGRTVHDLAQGVGQVVAMLGAHEATHRPPASELDAEWSWRDAESPAFYSEAFAGEILAEYVPLMVMLQGAVATAALVARTDCCGECGVAAFKHRLVVAHHVARSLVKLQSAGLLGSAAAMRVDALLSEASVVEVLGMRALRNGLVHLGLSDVPESAFASPDPFGSVVAYYAAGHSYAEVQQVVDRAVARLHAQLTDWLLTPSQGRAGIIGITRAPA